MNRASFLKFLLTPLLAPFVKFLPKREKPSLPARDWFKEERTYIGRVLEDAPSGGLVRVELITPPVEPNVWDGPILSNAVWEKCPPLLDPELTRISRHMDSAHRDFILDPWFK